MKPTLPAHFRTIRSHPLDGKNVQWHTLDRVETGRGIDYARTVHNGTVLTVETTGRFALVCDRNDQIHDLEITDLDVCA